MVFLSSGMNAFSKSASGNCAEWSLHEVRTKGTVEQREEQMQGLLSLPGESFASSRQKRMTCAADAGCDLNHAMEAWRTRSKGIRVRLRRDSREAQRTTCRREDAARALARVSARFSANRSTAVSSNAPENGRILQASGRLASYASGSLVTRRVQPS